MWSGSYWREYLGPVGGRVGVLVQRLCARVPQRAYCFSELHARRLREEGLRGSVTVLRGLWTGQVPPRVDGDDERSAEAEPRTSRGPRAPPRQRRASRWCCSRRA